MYKTCILMLMVLPLLPARAFADNQSSSIAIVGARSATARSAPAQAEAQSSAAHRARGSLATDANRGSRTCTYWSCGTALLLGIGF